MAERIRMTATYTPTESIRTRYAGSTYEVWQLPSGAQISEKDAEEIVGRGAGEYVKPPEEKTVAELQGDAKKLGVSGASQKNRAELQSAVKEKEAT